MQTSCERGMNPLTQVPFNTATTLLRTFLKCSTSSQMNNRTRKSIHFDTPFNLLSVLDKGGIREENIQ